MYATPRNRYLNSATEPTPTEGLSPVTYAAKEDKDADLVRRIKAHDNRAFTELYRRHADRTKTIALRVLKNEADAEDITQRVFMSIFQKIGSFRGEAKFSTWLGQITTNTALLSLRESKADKRGGVLFSIDDVWLDRGRGAEDDVGGMDFIKLGVDVWGNTAPTPDDVLEGREVSARLDRALASLREGDRDLLEQVTLHERPQAEIAAEMGVPLTKVKMRLHRIRKKLRARAGIG